MKKIFTVAGAAVLSFAALQANAISYSVSGTFDWPNANVTVPDVAGDVDLLSGGALTVSGNVTTDTNAAGYNITGGTLALNGAVEVVVGDTLHIEMRNLTGTATNDGVLFNSGQICAWSVDSSSCDFTDIDVSVDNISFLSGTAWGSDLSLTTAGLKLAGGAGGSSFTVAQAGTVADAGLAGGAAGAASLLGFPAGIFLGGNLNFVQQDVPPPVETPVPATIWMFGSGLVGLTGVARRRNKKS